MGTELRLEGAVYTHLGKRRNNNEDNYYLFGKYRKKVNKPIQKRRKKSLTDSALVAVCDGMGGEEAGEVASWRAVATLHPLEGKELQSQILQQISQINTAVCRERIAKGGKHMGTTFVGLYIAGETAVCCNVGDSRAYLYRDKQFRQLSKDHSEAQRQIDLGRITQEQARKEKSWHCLTQHIGLFPEELEIKPFLSEPFTIQKGDIYLLCSDGLSDSLSDSEIAEILEPARKVSGYTKELMERVLQTGAKDNVTIAVVCVR